MSELSNEPSGNEAGESALVSVVVPCFNEADCITEAHSRLSTTLAAIKGIEYELIFVDDGSSDETLDELRTLQAHDSHAVVIALSRNFGHQIAVTAGLDAARGDAVVLIDADLQDPPELIGDMVAEWRNGFDVIYGVRSQRKGETAFKLMTAKVFYRLISKLSEVRIPLDTGDFRLMSRRAVEALKAMPERDRFMRGMVAWIGFNQKPLHYERAPRFAGRTKYPLMKMIRFATDGIFSFSAAPLRLATYLGIVTASLSVVGMVYAFAMRILTDNWERGWTLLFIALLFIGGVQLISLGIIGEYIGRIYGEAKRRPLYLVKEYLTSNTRTMEQTDR